MEAEWWAGPFCGKKIMKTFMTKIIIGIMLIACILGGCGNTIDDGTGESKGNYYDNSDLIRADNRGSMTGFDFVILSREKVNDVVYVQSWNGTEQNAQVTVVITKNTLKEYEDFKYRGLYCSCWLFDLRCNEGVNCIIDKMELKVDGEPKTIYFKSPIRMGGSTDDLYIFNDYLSGTFVPNDFSSRVLVKEESFEYVFEVLHDCVYIGAEVGAGLEIANVECFVNGQSVTGASRIDLHAGDDFRIHMTYSAGKENLNGSYIFSVTDLAIKFVVRDQVRTATVPITFSPISPMDSELNKLKTFIDFCVD